MEGMDWGGEKWGAMGEYGGAEETGGKSKVGGKTRWNIIGRGSRVEGRWEWECRLLYCGEKRLGNNGEGIFYATSNPPPQPAPLPTSI